MRRNISGLFPDALGCDIDTVLPLAVYATSLVASFATKIKDAEL